MTLVCHVKDEKWHLVVNRLTKAIQGKSLWNCETDRHIFRATMCLERFHDISRVLWFDSKTDRMERRAKDKLAPIRNVWNQWVEILPKLYNSGENVTADEQLVAFRGRCPFRQYIPSKPAKYGIKIWTLYDSKRSYALNVQVYTGKAPDERPEKNQGMHVVLDLTHGLKGQNVTCDNFFTSYQLGQMLKKKQLTMLGTVRKNKPELPQDILSKREVYSSTFYFSGNTTVVSYVPKKPKQVILMSTMHHDNAVSDREDRKPDIILDYNATKGAVDTLDQVISTYTCKRKTNRWPMIIFYNILDVSAYNAFVLWREIDPDWNRNKLHLIDGICRSSKETNIKEKVCGITQGQGNSVRNNFHLRLKFSGDLWNVQTLWITAHFLIPNDSCEALMPAEE
ncbi:piggyBac transposable element-derived protein 4-like [Leptodactylus fuscus]